MNRNSASTRTRWWLAAALSFVALRALPNLSYPMGRDQATFAVLARGLLHGQQLYKDVWDIKPPAICYVYALIVKLFGPAMWSVGLVDIVLLLLTSYCIFRFAQRYLGAVAASLAVIINALYHCGGDYVVAAQPESFLTLFVFAAYFSADGPGCRSPVRQFAAGMLLGGAFWLKYNGAVFLPLLLIVPWFDWSGFDVRPRRFKLLIPWRAWLGRSAILLAGFATVILAVLSHFYLAGLWGTFWDSHLRVISVYGASALQMPDYWYSMIALTILAFRSYSATFRVLSVCAPFVAWCMASKKHELSQVGPIVAAAALGYLSVASQLRFPPYGYEACYPFFAMVWAYLALKTYEWAGSAGLSFPGPGFRSGRAFCRAGLIVLLCWVLIAQGGILARRYRELGEWWRDGDSFYAGYSRQIKFEHLAGELQVVRLIKRNSRPGDYLYVWGTAPLIYYMTHSRIPTRFVYNFPLMSPWGPAAWRQELMRDLDASPPAFIVVARNDALTGITLTPLDSEKYLSLFRELDAYIARSYEPVALLPDFVVYRKAALSHGGRPAL